MLQFKNGSLVLLGSVVFALLGVALYRLQGNGMTLMNPLGVVSFASLGACLGCLAVDRR